MIKCPLCSRENEETTSICSCGKILKPSSFSGDPEIDKMMDDPKVKEVLEQVKKRTTTVAIIIISSLILIPVVILLVVNLSENRQTPKTLRYELINGYEKQERPILFSFIDNVDINVKKSTVKKVVDIGQGTLYCNNDNIDEQIIVFEQSIGLVQTESEAKKLLDRFEKACINGEFKGDFKYTFLNNGVTTYRNQNKIYFSHFVVNFEDGDKRYAIFSLIEFDEYFYCIVINSYYLDNSIDKLFTWIESY